LSAKPTLTAAEVSALLEERLGERPTSVERLVEGLESQAFRLQLGDEELVVRVNPSSRGFEKDRWAYDHLRGRVPVPRVVELGSLDDRYAYCLTECAPGETLEALAPREAANLVGAVADIWRAIAATDVSSIKGFGDFEPDGQAPAASWGEVLQMTLDRGRASRLTGAGAVLEAYAGLVERCPEEHALIHGDFGSNNVVSDGPLIRAVLDWENAMVGDSLYDVANTYFWATHLACMELQAGYFGRSLPRLPAFKARILCYSLRIGIEEACDGAAQGRPKLTAWALARCAELLAGSY
jgi:hygromycin-B 4-O-kinase